MTKTTSKEHEPSSAPKTVLVAGFAGVWLAGMGALAYGTHPNVQTALNTSAQAQEETVLNTPVYTPAATTRPASVTTQDPAGERAAGKNHQNVDFIVRFENDIPELEACRKLFRTDKQTARKIFSDWAADYEAMKGIRLKKVSFSGEMLLAWNTGVEGPMPGDEIQARLTQIKDMPGVRYADPDYTAQAEGPR